MISLVLSGTVVGAPGADNLKIRPEFFPVGVGFLDSNIVVGQKRFQACINDITSVITAQAVIHIASTVKIAISEFAGMSRLSPVVYLA
ncbi:hypothetical protein [Photobacterium sp. WH80]|uniref:hypothetical protein n=1 Tax=Photobacterium sp. WH80 TaxID=2913414 RepID=UPI001EDB58CD|nr:hypothetical protein [Photobacterium sp. WH80]MBV7261690.1 hypothetical protein [Photobacterium sp. WH24]MCG2843791.1 hypothetical protein [Photobacterium sp. WH80]